MSLGIEICYPGMDIQALEEALKACLRPNQSRKMAFSKSSGRGPWRLAFGQTHLENKKNIDFGRFPKDAQRTIMQNCGYFVSVALTATIFVVKRVFNYVPIINCDLCILSSNKHHNMLGTLKINIFNYIPIIHCDFCVFSSNTYLIICWC